MFCNSKKSDYREYRIELDYKLLRASIGFNLLAFLAGIYPNTIPTTAENPTASEMVANDTEKPIPIKVAATYAIRPVSYTHLRAHETRHDLVCRLLLEKKQKQTTTTATIY